MNEVIVRQEEKEDYGAVFALIKDAFSQEVLSDHKEQFLVDRLRKSSAFIPKLSLVAILKNKIVGHILLTKLKIRSSERSFDSLALAPISVLPSYQRRGIGSALINNAHKVAIELGYTSVVLIGHENYYPRFGYKRADAFGIELPFDVPKENCMVIELTENSLMNVSGCVEYPKEFYS